VAYKDIVVHAEKGRAGEARINYALAFARAHGALLTAVAFAPTVIVPDYGEVGVIAPMPKSYFEELEDGAKAALKQAEAAGEKLGVSVETQMQKGVAGDFPQLLARRARFADLTIVGQPVTGAMWSQKGELASRLLMASGRPLLVVPDKGFEFRRKQAVLAAWDGSAEAARAFHDALPLLAEAEQVYLYAGEDPDLSEETMEEPGASIIRHLSRHEIKAELRMAQSDELTIGELLLKRAAEEGVGLMVMGGFHHSRLREMLIGGVTKTILEKMTTPVFMSH